MVTIHKGIILCCFIFHSIVQAVWKAKLVIWQLSVWPYTIYCLDSLVHNMQKWLNVNLCATHKLAYWGKINVSYEQATIYIPLLIFCWLHASSATLFSTSDSLCSKMIQVCVSVSIWDDKCSKVASNFCSVFLSSSSALLSLTYNRKSD